MTTESKADQKSISSTNVGLLPEKTLKAGTRVKITNYRGPKEIASIYMGKDGTLMCCDSSRSDTCGNRWLVDLDHTAGKTGPTTKSWHHHSELTALTQKPLWPPAKALPATAQRRVVSAQRADGSRDTTPERSIAYDAVNFSSLASRMNTAMNDNWHSLSGDSVFRNTQIDVQRRQRNAQIYRQQGQRKYSTHPALARQALRDTDDSQFAGSVLKGDTTQVKGYSHYDHYDLSTLQYPRL